MDQLILGSQSPRRREILSYFSIPFTPAISNFDEDSIIFRGDPENYVCEISDGKAQALHAIYPRAIILTADTEVYRDGKVYGKPRDRQHAFAVLRELSGNWHSVYTGLTIQKGKNKHHLCEETRVLFNDLSDEQINRYLDTFQWSDKTAGYGIQMGGGLIVQKIEGCFYNIMGLPVNSLVNLFAKVGIDLWHHIKA